MLSHVGLRAGLYLVSVSLSFGSMQGVCKEYSKHREKQHVLAVLLMFFDFMFNYVCEVFFWCCGGI